MKSIYVLLLTILATNTAQAGPIHAIIIGVNRSLNSEARLLQYADDDAILFHRIFSQLGRSLLLTAPDEATRQIYGVIADVKPPTMANVQSAIETLLFDIQQEQSRGERPELYFIYSGHGEEKNNEGYLSLVDGRFTAHDLIERLLARSSATVNHIIIDACKSYFMVLEKRAGGIREPIYQPFYQSSSLVKRFPNTGFLLSTSSGTNSHEWEEFQAGIFSHEVRSGILGAADVNRDGQVSYNELQAFIKVANSHIANEKYRPAIFAHPPHNDGTRALIDLRDQPMASITISPQKAGRYFIEDPQGVRLADMHTHPSLPIKLFLTRYSRLYLHDLGRSLEYQLVPKPEQQLVALKSRPTSYRNKGAAHEAFTKLFSEPLSQSAYEKALANTKVAQAEPHFDQMTSKQAVTLPPAIPAKTSPAKTSPAITFAKRFSFAFLMGTGMGYVVGGYSEHTWPQANGPASSINIQSGAALTPFHLCPEISWHLKEKWSLSFNGRIQVVNTASTLNKITNVSWLGNLRFKRFGEGRWYSPYFSFGAGIGQIRHSIPVPYYSDATFGDSIVDTRVAGLGNVSGSVGILFKLSNSIGLVLEENTLILFPDFAINFDFNAGVAYSI